MTKTIKLLLVTLFTTISLYADKDKTEDTKQASNKNDLTIQEDNKVQLSKEHFKIAVDKSSHLTNQATLEKTIISLATQLVQNQKLKISRPMLITSFVQLSNLKKTTDFGQVISESLINDLSNKGFNIMEFRSQPSISINAHGEYFITRNANKVKHEVVNTYVIVGTYARQSGYIMLNARVIDNNSGRIISTARSTYVHNLRTDCTIFKDCKPPRTIQIVKE